MRAAGGAMARGVASGAAAVAVHAALAVVLSSVRADDAVPVSEPITVEILSVSEPPLPVAPVPEPEPPALAPEPAPPAAPPPAPRLARRVAPAPQPAPEPAAPSPAAEPVLPAVTSPASTTGEQVPPGEPAGSQDATAPAPSAAVTGTGGTGAPGGSATRAPDSQARAPQLAGGATWKCPFPAEADDAEIHRAVVGLQVEVDAGGEVMAVNPISDPGHGFAREAMRCARRKRWAPGLDSAGQAIKAIAVVNVRFER